MASNQTSGAAASRYASALVDTALAAKALDSVEKDMHELQSMLTSSPDLQKAVQSPVLKRAELLAFVQAFAQKSGFHKLTQNFLSLLTQNRRLNILSAILPAVRADISRRRGEVNARVQTATPLSSEQQRALVEALSKTTGRSVNLHLEIDQSLIGGMIVTVGSKMIDDSIKRKLERLERAMKSNSNQNLTQQKEVS